MGVTVLLATHAADVAAAATRILRMRDGKFEERHTLHLQDEATADANSR
jgi:ABC-type lipoprotein export system ATPase subunit